jgi:hypothetical protein
MNPVIRLFKYVYYFLTSETKQLRSEAYSAAQKYYGQRPLLSEDNPYPTLPEYRYRTVEFQNFQRGFINQRCHECAIAKLNKTEVNN